MFDLPKLPSERDQRIYYEVAVMGRKQIDMARRWGLSQPRIVQIMQKVEKFVDELGPPSKVDRDRRFFIATLMYRIIEQGLADYRREAPEMPQILGVANDTARLRGRAVTATPGAGY